MAQLSPRRWQVLDTAPAGQGEPGCGQDANCRNLAGPLQGEILSVRREQPAAGARLFSLLPPAQHQVTDRR